MTDDAGTAFIHRAGDETAQGWFEIDSTSVWTSRQGGGASTKCLMISDVAKEKRRHLCAGRRRRR
jgi:hypothetical protein